MKTILIGILFLSIIQIGLAQTKFTAGASFGFPTHNWGYEGTIDGLRSQTRSSWSISAFGSKVYNNNWSGKLEIGVNRFGEALSFNGMKTGQPPIVSWIMTPTISKNLNLEGTRFSIEPGIGVSLAYYQKSKYTFDRDSFKVFGRLGKDNQGNEIWIPVNNLTIDGFQDVVSQFAFLIRPELNINYHLNDNSMVFLRGLVGIGFNENIVERDFYRVNFDGEDYEANHKLGSSYTSFDLGYKVSFNR